jgi:hypothetical protein
MGPEETGVLVGDPRLRIGERLVAQRPSDQDRSRTPSRPRSARA